jgi:hypothetical protein
MCRSPALALGACAWLRRLDCLIAQQFALRRSATSFGLASPLAAAHLRWCPAPQTTALGNSPRRFVAAAGCWPTVRCGSCNRRFVNCAPIGQKTRTSQGQGTTCAGHGPRASPTRLPRFLRFALATRAPPPRHVYATAFFAVPPTSTCRLRPHSPLRLLLLLVLRLRL